MHASCHLVVKESGYVSKCNPTGELSLEVIFSPVHHSSDCKLPMSSVHQLKNQSNYQTSRTRDRNKTPYSEL